MVRDPCNTAGWAAEVSMHAVEDQRPVDNDSGDHLRRLLAESGQNEERHVYEDEATVVADDLTASEEGYIEPPD